MTKQLRMIIKIIIVLGCLLLLKVVIDQGREIMIRQPDGTFARVQDVMNLSRALTPDITESEIYRQLAARYQKDNEAFLTYEEYQRILTAIGTQETERFAGEYRPEHYLLAADWRQAFETMRRFYDNEGAIVDLTVTLAGMEEAVTDGAGRRLRPYQLLDAKGEVFTFASDEFRKYNYRTVEALGLGRELLYVTGIRETAVTLPNTFLLSLDAVAPSVSAPGIERELVYFFRNYEVRVGLSGSGELDDKTGDTGDNNNTGDTGNDTGKAGRDPAEQVADLHFEDGQLTEIAVKPDKINGKLLAVGDDTVTIEGHGTFRLAPELMIYRLYDSLKIVGREEILMGYDFADFVLEQGEICAALITRKEATEYIRVAIRTDDFAGLSHERLTVTADAAYTVTYGAYDDRQNREFRAGEELSLTADSEYLEAGNLVITPAVKTGKVVLLSLKRNQGVPAYRGTMEISRGEDGLLAVNELLLEEYLYSVVPSEMPASYPLESLKAQAICARTFACRYLLNAGLGSIGAHVDDSVGYQVYNNIAEDSTTTKAVKETTGKMLYYDEEPAQTYYYSTSCGYGTIAEVWKNDSAGAIDYLKATVIGRDDRPLPEEMCEEEKFAAFIGAVRASDYESKEPWYRWSMEITGLTGETVAENMRARYNSNSKLVLTLDGDEYVSRPIRSVGNITDIYCAKRLPGGVMDEVVIVTDQDTFKVVSENAIRAVLNDGKTKVIRQDGSAVSSPNLLPSAFMIIKTVKKDGIVVGYRLTGGGYGHGVGMSQNGARALGEQGQNSAEILTGFYKECEIRQVY